MDKETINLSALPWFASTPLQSVPYEARIIVAAAFFCLFLNYCSCFLARMSVLESELEIA